MSVNYRVSVKPFEGETFIYELFETKTDADAYFKDLIEDKDGILSAMPCKVMVVTFEQFLEGTWIVTNKKTVIQ